MATRVACRNNRRIALLLEPVSGEKVAECRICDSSSGASISRGHAKDNYFQGICKPRRSTMSQRDATIGLAGVTIHLERPTARNGIPILLGVSFGIPRVRRDRLRTKDN